MHPDQVAAVRRAYTPEDAEVEWAKALIAAFEQESGLAMDAGRHAEPTAVGAFSFRNQMIDAPVVLQAQRVLSRYDATRRH